MQRPVDIWKNQPEKHDYPAAQVYLSLLFEERSARKLVAAFRRAPTVWREAKDLLRASALPLLAKDDPHVAGDIKKLKKGDALSPVLVVRGAAKAGLPLIIADGYHRICASWYKGEDIAVACRIVDRPNL
jgi:hypothetical protein